MAPSNRKENISERRINRHRQQHSAKNSKPQYFGCGICKADHRIMTCKKFLNLNLTQKYKTALQLHYCTNCLARNHVVKDCKNQTRCKICSQKHHSILHGHQKVLKNIPTEVNQRQQCLVNQKGSTKPGSTAFSSLTTTGFPSSVLRTLVPTAEIFVTSEEGSLSVRAVLNPSSLTSRVASSFVRDHSIDTFKLDGKVYAKLTFTPNMTSLVKYNICMRVVNDLPKKPYTRSFNESIRTKFDHISLADPYFNMDSHINIEIGGDVYTSTLKPNTIHVDGGSLIAQDSTLGWLIMGSYLG